MKESDVAEQPTTGHLRRARLGRITLWKSYALIREEQQGGKTVASDIFFKNWLASLSKSIIISSASKACCKKKNLLI